MPRKCTICIHDKRKEIESELLKGESFRRISTEFEVSMEALRRHKNNGHLGKELIEAKGVETVKRSEDLFSQLEYWGEEIREIYRDAKKNKEKVIALTAVDKAMKFVTLTFQVKSMFYEIKNIKEFQEEVINTLGELDPDAQARFIKRLQEKRGIQ